MATYEKSEILTRPPNVYRQTLNVDNLISVCSKKLSEDPNHKKALFIRASSYLKKGNFQASIEDCNRLMQLDNYNAGAYYVRGCAYEKLDMTDKSIEDFTSVLEIDPNHINAAYARGACENKRGNFAKAIDDYNMALAIDQERPISPSLNRRQQQRANLSNILDMTQGGRSDHYPMSLDQKQSQTFSSSVPRGGLAQQSPLNIEAQHNGGAFPGNNGLMSPSINQSSRAGYMNETRGSMQSSILKAGTESRYHNMNQSIGGASVASASRNFNNHNFNPGMGQSSKLRIQSMNSSVDFKNGNHSATNSMMGNMMGGSQYGMFGSNYPNTPVQNLKLLEQMNLAEYREYMNQSIGGASVASASRNFNNHNFNPGMGQSSKLRIQSMNSSVDFKNGNHSATNSMMGNMMGGSQYGMFGSNYPNTPVQNLKLLEQTNPAEYREYMKQKQAAEQFHARGYDARKKGDYELAIQQYSEALQIFPHHFKALFNRGFAYDKMGMFDQAIDDYSNAIQLDPNNAYTYYNKGISLDRKGDYDEAINCFTQAISIESNKADFYHNRGFAYRKKKEFDNAIKDYESAIRIDP